MVKTGEFPTDYWPEEARRLRLTLAGVAVFPAVRPSLSGRATQVGALFVEPPDFGVTQAGCYVFEDVDPVAVRQPWALAPSCRCLQSRPDLT